MHHGRAQTDTHRRPPTSSFRLETSRTQLSDGWPGILSPAAPRAAAVGFTPASGIPVKGMPETTNERKKIPMISSHLNVPATPPHHHHNHSSWIKSFALHIQFFFPFAKRKREKEKEGKRKKNRKMEQKEQTKVLQMNENAKRERCWRGYVTISFCSPIQN